MATKRAGDDGEPRVSKKLWRSKQNKDHVQEDFDPIVNEIILMKMVWEFRPDTLKIRSKFSGNLWMSLGLLQPSLAPIIHLVILKS